jgi:hypothetical protein
MNNLDAYLGCLGIPRTHQWKAATKFVSTGIYSGRATTRVYKPKYFHASAFIELYSDAAGQALPSVEGNIQEGEAVKCIPFETVRDFYEEYISECEKTNEISSIAGKTYIAGYKTFLKACKSMKKTLRFMRCKGNFSCCEICDNAAAILRDKNRLRTNEAKDIVKHYRRKHLHDQAQERINLEKNIRKSREVDSITGQPTTFLLLPDGMTKSKGALPKIGKGYRQIKCDVGRPKLENRVIGVYVVCGTIEGMFLYTTNQLVDSGADTMIEVVRQAMLDLQQLLNNDGYELPKNALFQFDNCGENKNKLMFSYLSLLVERHDFDTIKVNFLIVGHTHCIVDQYFSTLSQKIRACEFIGTPMALKHLFDIKNDEKSVYKPPLINRQLDVFYDLWTPFEPYINKKIKFYQVFLTLRYNYSLTYFIDST